MGLLDNKVCVITGGAGSVGLASAQLFLREGARVMVVDLREADVARAAKALNSPNAATHVADVTKTADVKAYFDATVEKFGKIDVLFSNAGNSGVVTPVTEYPEDVFDSVIAVHVRGAFLACKYGLPQMNNGGSVIITSSVVGVRGDGGGSVAYVTAKHAQVGLMRSVSKNGGIPQYPGQHAASRADRQPVPARHRGRHHETRRPQRDRAAQRDHSAQAPCPARGNRAHGVVPCVRYVELHDRRDDPGRRRDECVTSQSLRAKGMRYGSS